MTAFDKGVIMFILKATAQIVKKKMENSRSAKSILQHRP
jgi:hypothetical protein